MASKEMSTPEVVAPTPTVFYNLDRETLVAHAIAQNRGFRIETTDQHGEVSEGALSIETKKNSRSAQDKYYVKTEGTAGKVWEKINRPMSSEDFTSIATDVTKHLATGDSYVVDVALGADTTSPMRKTFRFITESPSHALFVKNLYRELTPEEKQASENEEYRPDITVLHAPDFKTDPEKYNTRSEVTIVADYEAGKGIIVGTDYLGEMKKFGFTLAHYFAETESTKDVSYAIIHGSLFQKADGSAVAVLGGSGAGKSSALPNPDAAERALGLQKVGDDEILVTTSNEKLQTENIEGGFYVTMTNAENEPDFREAAEHTTSMLENVTMHETTKRPNYPDTTKTPNTRAAIDWSSLPKYNKEGISGKLADIIYLDPDTRGVLPPLAQFKNTNQTLLYGLLGLGAAIPGREQGVTKIEEKFLPWLDEPFLVFPPEQQLDTMKKIYDVHKTKGWLVSSGWRGGPIGVGARPPVESTQASVKVVVDGLITDEMMVEDPIFGFLVPKETAPIDVRVKPSANNWDDTKMFEEQKIELAKKIIQEFNDRYGHLDHPMIQELARELPRIPGQEITVFTSPGV